MLIVIGEFFIGTKGSDAKLDNEFLDLKVEAALIQQYRYLVKSTIDTTNISGPCLFDIKACYA